MPEGVIINELYSIGAFLPASELQTGTEEESVLPFANDAITQYKEVVSSANAEGEAPSFPTPEALWEAVLKSADNVQQEFDAFRSTGRSNNRPMQYIRMCIPPNKSFPLHAHPNVELIHVARGTLHERRLREDQVPTSGPFDELYHVDISDYPQEAFHTRSFTKGQVLVNEIGSVHRSFTTEEGADLFVLWGGGHCNVPEEFTPISERVEDAVHENHVDIVEDTSCSAWIANALVDAGVTHVYGGHGGALAPLVNAVVNQPRLTWVCCRNEANAALMAAAHAKHTGNLACVIATSGPGATNLTTGLIESTMDQVPVLALTGVKPRQGMHYSEFQDADQSRLFAAAGVQFSFDVASPEALVPLLRDAVAVATTRNTCAHLAIPVDIQAADCPIPVNKHFCAAHAADRVAPSSVLDESALDNVVELLSVENKKVLIAIGLRAVEDGDDILKLAEILRAPIVTRLDAKGAVDEKHPLVLGVEGIHGKPGMETSATLMETADIVVNFGVDDCSLLVCNTAGLQVREMIEFQTTALMVSTRFRAIQTCIGDMSAMARALVERFESRQRAASNLGGLRASMTKMNGVKRAPLTRRTSTDLVNSELVQAHMGATDLIVGVPEDRAHRAAELWWSVHSGKWIGKQLDLTELEAVVLHHDTNMTTKENPPVYGHPALALVEVSRHLTKDVTVCIDTGDVTLWAGLCLKLPGGSRTLTSERMGTMGYSVCAGIASILSREAPATSLVLVGDGGFQMTLQELATFQQHKRPGDRLIVIVFDNQLLGRVIFGFDGAKGCELAGPDFAALAAAYGGEGHRLTDEVQIGEHVRDAKDGLTILHVPIDPHLKADMATFNDGAVKMMNSG